LTINKDGTRLERSHYLLEFVIALNLMKTATPNLEERTVEFNGEKSKYPIGGIGNYKVLQTFI
jgi:hypothetical protein